MKVTALILSSIFKPDKFKLLLRFSAPYVFLCFNYKDLFLLFKFINFLSVVPSKLLLLSVFVISFELPLGDGSPCLYGDLPRVADVLALTKTLTSEFGETKEPRNKTPPS